MASSDLNCGAWLPRVYREGAFEDEAQPGIATMSASESSGQIGQK
jgi:hypothetical protein